MAAPTVRKILDDILPYLGVEAHYTEEELQNVDTVVPYLNGLTAEDAGEILTEKGFAYTTVGEGDTVTDQIPAASSTVPRSAKIIMYMGEEKPVDTVTVPNLVGYTIEDVKYIMSFNTGIYLKTEGATHSSSDSTAIYSSSQDIEPGTEVDRGTVVTVEFIDTTAND